MLSASLVGIAVWASVGAVTIMAISSSGRPDVVVYPDSGKVGVGERLPKGGGLRGFFLQDNAVDYWTGEDAPDADA